MSSSKMELYAYPASSACRLVTTVMELLGLDYEYKITNLQKGDHLTPEFLKASSSSTRYKKDKKATRCA